MLAKSSLNEISFDKSIVLNDNEFKLLKNDRFILNKLVNDDYLDVNICSVILHDQDIDEEIGQLKTPHYHVAIRFNKKFMNKSVIERLVELFHINENQITIKKLSSLESYTRYLIHLDDGDKHPYLPFDIVTNNQDFVNDCLKNICIKDEKHCLEVVKRFHYHYEDIIVNVVNWKKYNSLIKDFIRMRGL